MPRVIQTVSKPTFGFKINNYYTDGTVDTHCFYVDDKVDNLSYVDNETVKTISGRIDKVGTAVNGITRTKYYTKDSYLSIDINIPIVLVDASKDMESNVVLINTKDILAFEPTKEVDHVNIVPALKVNERVVYADGNTSEMMFEEGKDIYGLTFMKDHKLIQGDYTVSAFIYNEKPSKTLYDNLQIIGVKLSNSKSIVYVPFRDMIGCGAEATIFDESDTLSNTITNITYGGVTLPETTVDEKLTIKNNVTLKGNKSNIPANTGMRCTTLDIDGETVLTNTLDAVEGADVTLNGVTLTTNALINIGSANSFTIDNCRLFGVETSNNKNYLIKDTFNTENKEGVLLQIENCYFGDNVVTSASGTEKVNVYNLFEINSKLADGSYIKNNYFSKPACSHNVINLYDVMDGANIEISGNHFEYSANAVRIGFVGDPKCTVNIKNNIICETDTSNDGEYAGIALIQPYGKKTNSFKNVKVNFENNKYPSGYQLYYYYAGSNDAQLKDEDMPKVYIDGKLDR